MTRNYFRVIHITIEKIIIGNTQPAHVPEKFPEGPLKVLTFGTYRKPSGKSPVDIGTSNERPYEVRFKSSFVTNGRPADVLKMY